MDPSCGFCLGGSCNGSPPWTDPKCPEHGLPENRHLALPPEDLDAVVKAFVYDDPNGHEKDHVGRVMKHYRGTVNPKVVVEKVREVVRGMLPQQRAGHTAECDMDGCDSIPKCRVFAMTKKLEETILRISDEHHRKLIADLKSRGLI